MATLSQNITQAISDLNDIKTAIQNKGVTVPANTPTSDYDSLIANIPTGDDSTLKGLIQCTITSLDIPQGVTAIGTRAFYYRSHLTSITIPSSVTSIGVYAFAYCEGITSITIPNSVTSIEDCAFQNCLRLTSITIPASVTSIGASVFISCSRLTNAVISAGVTTISSNMFWSCANLTTISIPSSVTTIANNAFASCTNLEYVTLANGFNANKLTLSSSTKYSHDTILSWLNALADRTGQTAYTLTMGSTNLAKLTADEIAIATNKNWNLA